MLDQLATRAAHTSEAVGVCFNSLLDVAMGTGSVGAVTEAFRVLAAAALARA